jgi:hypothetical protein
MADIFISYAKPDRRLALNLEARLASEGWTVWWDKGLHAGDNYSEAILAEINKARVVIVIWTKSSVRSDWVWAEADRARATGKLIPVKTADLPYSDIPLPFNKQHTEDVADVRSIMAAVVRQLSRPVIEPTQLWLATKIVRVQILTWIGIVGGTITAFSGATAIFTLADWARWIVDSWKGWTQAFWSFVFALVSVQVPWGLGPPLTFIASTAMMATGLRLFANDGRQVDTANAARSDRRWLDIGLGALCVLPAVIYLIIGLLAVLHIDSRDTTTVEVPITVVGFGACSIPLFLLYKSTRRIECAFAILLYCAFCAVILFEPLLTMSDVARADLDDFLSADNEDLRGVGYIFRYLSVEQVFIEATLNLSILIFQLGVLFVILLAPTRALILRLCFIMMGVGALLLLNQISLLDLKDALRRPAQ